MGCQLSRHGDAKFLEGGTWDAVILGYFGTRIPNNLGYFARGHRNFYGTGPESLSLSTEGTELHVVQNDLTQVVA